MKPQAVSRPRRPTQVLTLLFAAIVCLAIGVTGMAKTRQNRHALGTSASLIDVLTGELAFQERCAICHSHTTAQKIGPGLKGFYGRVTFANGKAISDPAVEHWIETGSKTMPGFRDVLNREEIRALIAYLRRL